MDESNSTPIPTSESQTQTHLQIPIETPNSRSFFNLPSNSMAQSHGSPITQIAQDHLLSILLLLPINSILSFSTTCKRFKALASLDALWEAVCRRDWGSTRVDAIKSSYGATAKLNDMLHIPWMKLYKQISQLGNVYCSRLVCSVGDDELFPNPRASHSLNFTSDCLVLFGGGCDGGRHLDDTWVAYTDETKKVLKWHKLSSGIPSGRFGHTCAVVDECLVLFGGINDHGIRQNDTWVGRITRGTHDMKLTWRLLEVGSVAPPPRGAHAGCCIGNSRMLIYGGIGHNGVRLGDTWILHLSEDLQLGTWHEIVTYPSPPARSGHTLTYIDNAKTVLFGGRGLGYEVLSDVWLFDTFSGNLRWEQILYDLRSIPGGISLPRVGHSATLTLGGQILIYGGEDSNRNRKNDTWLLDVNSVPAIQMNYPPISTNSVASTLAKMWKRLKTDGYMPYPRSFHAACADHSGLFLYVFGGMVDGEVQPAESNGLRFDGDFFLVELQLI